MAGAQSGTDRRGLSTEVGPRRRSGAGYQWGRWPASEPRRFGPPLAAVDGISVLPMRASLAIGEAGFALVTRRAEAVSISRLCSGPVSSEVLVSSSKELRPPIREASVDDLLW